MPDLTRNFYRRVAGTVVIGAGVAAAFTGAWGLAQEAVPTFHAKVDLVVLTFTVTDSKGKYVNGLKPSDFRVTEDGIQQKLATFAEGDRPAMEVGEGGILKPLTPQSPAAVAVAKGSDKAQQDTFAGTSVFVLFDTSNFMYRGFVYAEDAIGDFIRGLDKADSVAVYTFSRNLSRAAELTTDHQTAISGLRNAVAGDDTALYNGLLLALRDAAKVPGRKVIIVFSNGPDNASMVAPDDVRTVAEDEGIPIYVISTNDVNKDPISSSVFRRITSSTGGKAYWARSWQKQVEAFDAIREDIGNSYALTYYPAPNPNEGFRKVNIEIVTDTARKYRVRSRPGYRPRSY
ncbi:MAG TPA: VWA domain-containing protein [Bryobacteraceae bacterium]|nr:VWA domain-containing protein [Bryobacteraceae bacterium]